MSVSELLLNYSVIFWVKYCNTIKYVALHFVLVVVLYRWQPTFKMSGIKSASYTPDFTVILFSCNLRMFVTRKKIVVLFTQKNYT